MNAIKIELYDEIGDEDVFKSTGELNLETGWISNVVIQQDCGYKNASKHPDYNFSYGVLALNDKELEFTLNIDKSGQYQIPREELNEFKEKAVALLNSSGKKMKM